MRETFSPVWPRTRYGKESAPFENFVAIEVTTEAAAAVLRKSLRSMISISSADRGDAPERKLYAAWTFQAARFCHRALPNCLREAWREGLSTVTVIAAAPRAMLQ